MSKPRSNAARAPAPPARATSVQPRPTARRVPGDSVDLVAIDVDGTMLRTDKRLSREVQAAVREATEEGVRVVLATARPPRSMRDLYKHLALDTLQVNYNGALIYDPTLGRNVFHQPLASGLARKIIKLVRKIDPGVVVSIEILDKWYTDHVDETLPTETSRGFMPDFVGPLDAFLHVPVTKLMLLAPPERLGAIRAAVLRKFAGKVGVAVSDAHLLQVVHPSVDKAVALARVARHYAIEPHRVMAIGDAPNDTGMITWAGLGVAMGNAWDAVKQAADVIVPTNDEDGVAYALRTYVLRK